MQSLATSLPRIQQSSYGPIRRKRYISSAKNQATPYNTRSPLASAQKTEDYVRALCRQIRFGQKAPDQIADQIKKLNLTPIKLNQILSRIPFFQGKQELIKLLNPDLICAISRAPTTNPIFTPCGHPFDKTQLQIHLTLNKPQCPGCRAELDKSKYFSTLRLSEKQIEDLWSKARNLEKTEHLRLEKEATDYITVLFKDPRQGINTVFGTLKQKFGGSFLLEGITPHDKFFNCLNIFLNDLIREKKNAIFIMFAQQFGLDHNGEIIADIQSFRLSKVYEKVLAKTYLDRFMKNVLSVLPEYISEGTVSI